MFTYNILIYFIIFFCVVNSEELFVCSKHRLTRKDFMTIIDEESPLSHNILDAWSHFLNFNEKFRAPDSPCRFFLCGRNGVWYSSITLVSVLLLDVFAEMMYLQFFISVSTA